MAETAFSVRGLVSDSPVTAPEARPMPVQNTSSVISDNPDDYTHYAWLADGRVLRVNLAGSIDTLGSRYYEISDDGSETSVTIVGVHAR